MVAIKITLYRIGANSPLVDLLIEAAEQGKQVAVLVELKARFDERNNIAWATRLESAGIHVVYGLVNLKMHCKLCLVVRKETGGIRRYAHLATGNYNRTTSQHLHRHRPVHRRRGHRRRRHARSSTTLTGYSNKRSYRALLVAPVGPARPASGRWSSARSSTPRPAGRRGIIIKNNAVADPAMIKMLYRASQAGVPIDLIVRGVCCLRPGVPGFSENIRVRSIVGRFLEHSRLYSFENGGEPELYIGSADLMERNLDRRVEVLVPVTDPDHRSPPARRRARHAAQGHRARVAAPGQRSLRARRAGPRAARFPAVAARLVLGQRPRRRVVLTGPVTVTITSSGRA